MRTFWKPLLASLGTAAVAIAAAALPAAARPANQDEIIYLPIDRAFNETYFQNDKDYFDNRSIKRQLELIFFSYPELEIDRDTELLHDLYLDVLAQQGTSDPFIRTPDMPTPFNETSLGAPFGGFDSGVRGSEFLIETRPLR